MRSSVVTVMAELVGELGGPVEPVEGGVRSVRRAAMTTAKSSSEPRRLIRSGCGVWVGVQAGGHVDGERLSGGGLAGIEKGADDFAGGEASIEPGRAGPAGHAAARSAASAASRLSPIWCRILAVMT